MRTDAVTNTMILSSFPSTCPGHLQGWPQQVYYTGSFDFTGGDTFLDFHSPLQFQSLVGRLFDGSVTVLLSTSRCKRMHIVMD